MYLGYLGPNAIALRNEERYNTQKTKNVLCTKSVCLSGSAYSVAMCFYNALLLPNNLQLMDVDGWWEVINKKWNGWWVWDGGHHFYPFYSMSWFPCSPWSPCSDPDWCKILLLPQDPNSPLPRGKTLDRCSFLTICGWSRHGAELAQWKLLNYASLWHLAEMPVQSHLQ